jgi:hypothetical protein
LFGPSSNFSPSAAAWIHQPPCPSSAARAVAAIGVNGGADIVMNTSVGFASHGGAHVGITRGNPWVNIFNPYPTRTKPLPVVAGRGFQGSG